ncbi:MAG: amidohydrolase family protein, partial [Acidimicrobiales bacterium]
NPARAFGHYPKKGVIAPGSDADLVIFDPDGETKISPGTFDDGTGDSVYSGKVLAGRIRQVLLRGSLVVEDGSCLVRDAGAYLPRGA